MEPAKQAPNWAGIDHVQVAMPAGGDDVARRFYAGVLGLPETPKPAALAARGGAWFESGSTRIHVGVDEPFVPARKAHPALLMKNLRRFVAASGLDVTWNDEIPGTVRCHVFDPFGNRLELIEASADRAEDGNDGNDGADGARGDGSPW